MTETATVLDHAELAEKTRAELLAVCQARGLKATGWKRSRMLAELTGVPAPAPETARLSEERQAGDLAAKALEQRLKRTGRCLSTRCELACPAYEEGRKDAFGWQMCSCGHTQWAHAKAG